VAHRLLGIAQHQVHVIQALGLDGGQVIIPCSG
jgi:hypothetical protein